MKNAPRTAPTSVRGYSMPAMTPPIATGRKAANAPARGATTRAAGKRFIGTRLTANDLVETFDDAIELLRRKMSDLPAEALDGERSDLTDLDPRPLRQSGARDFMRQRESGARSLTRDG